MNTHTASIHAAARCCKLLFNREFPDEWVHPAHQRPEAGWPKWAWVPYPPHGCGWPHVSGEQRPVHVRFYPSAAARDLMDAVEAWCEDRRDFDGPGRSIMALYNALGRPELCHDPAERLAVEAIRLTACAIWSRFGQRDLEDARKCVALALAFASGHMRLSPEFLAVRAMVAKQCEALMAEADVMPTVPAPTNLDEALRKICGVEA